MESPKLDDRTFDDLRRELVRRIPVHAPQWTDHSPGDPGIALIEVFAWLAEGLLHRMNSVPDEAQLELLNLLGVPLKPARPARAMVRFDLPKGTVEPVLLPSLERAVVAAGEIALEAIGELEVLPVEALPVVKWPVVAGNERLQQVQQALQDNLAGAPNDLAPYTTATLPPARHGALPGATEIGLAVDRSLWIALLAPAGCAASNDELRATLAGRVLSVGVRTGDTREEPEPASRQPVVWQIATGSFTDGERRVDRVRYERLVVEEDTTGGFASSGVWRLRLPQDPASFGVWRADDLGSASLLGAGDLPPLLDDERLATRVITWVRCFRESSPPALAVRWVDVNVVAVEQAVTAKPEALGKATGRPGQAVRVAHVPVLEGSLALEVREPEGWVAWQVVDGFGASGPLDRRCVLEPSSGEVRFGDGIRGRMPRMGEAIRARSYRYGGGARGNVPAGAVSKVRSPAPACALRVTNPLPAEGGAERETVEQARARVPLMLRHHDRAVTAEDFHDLAMETPNVALGRVEVLPRHDPIARADGVPGVVTVIVIPAYDPLHPDEPVPDGDTLRRVSGYLEPRRLVTCEVHVTPPEYVAVWVSVALDVEPGFPRGAVGRSVELAIRRHLAPLPPYGPAGRGWPFGREVSAREIEAAVLRVEGVRRVKDVIVEGPSGPTSTVTLACFQLPVVRRVQLSAGDTAAPVDRSGDSTRAGGRFPVPVPPEAR